MYDAEAGRYCRAMLNHLTQIVKKANLLRDPTDAVALAMWISAATELVDGTVALASLNCIRSVSKSEDLLKY